MTYSTDLEVLPGEYVVPMRVMKVGESWFYELAVHRTAYRVKSVRLVNQKKPDPQWPFKYALRVLRCRPENIPKDAVQHRMFWTNRNKKREVSRE